MTALPGSLSLTTIASSAPILSADHRDNYVAIQTAVNELIAALSGGTVGQLLEALDGSDVAWQSPVTSYVPTGTVLEYAAITAPTGYLLCDGSAVSRTTYATLLATITIAENGVKVNGSPVITGLASTAGLDAGMPVEGPGIPGSTTILSVDSSTQITMSANATLNSTGFIAFFPWGEGDGASTFNVPDFRGRVAAGYAASGGHVDVSTLGLNDGVAAANRRPKHNSSYAGFTGTVEGSASGNTQSGGGGNVGASVPVSFGGYIGPAGTNPVDTPAYLVVNRIIKT